MVVSRHVPRICNDAVSVFFTALIDLLRVFALGVVPSIKKSSLSSTVPWCSTSGDAQESGTPDVNLTVQFIEIYNDKIRDLLHPGADSSAFRVREHPDIGPYVHNLIPVQVYSNYVIRYRIIATYGA